VDLVPAPVGRIEALAAKLDALDPGLYALVDLKNEIDAIIREFDDLGLDLHVETAAAAVDLDDARRVGLHDGARERSALLGLDFAFQLFILDLLVALKRDAVDHRIFDHGDNQASALNRRPAILEHTRAN